MYLYTTPPLSAQFPLEPLSFRGSLDPRLLLKDPACRNKEHAA